VGHRTDSADVFQQLHICSCIIKTVIANHGSKRLSTKLTKTAGIDVTIEPGLSNFRCKFKIIQQLFFSGGQNMYFNIFTRIGMVNQQFQ
jgi:hypothetical protein